MGIKILRILTHLAYIANAKKGVISNNVTVLRALGRCMLADINCHCKMTSVMALDDVTSIWHLKDVTNTCKHMPYSPTIAGFLQCNGRELEEAGDFKCIFVVYYVLESK